MAKAKGKKLLFVGKAILVINWIAIISLLLSFFAHFISPEKIIILAFIALAYPVIVLLNILFVIYWLLRLRWQLVYSLAAILLTWGTLTKFVHINFSKQPTTIKNQFKVLTYNVHNFDIYNYNKKWESDKTKRNQIFNYIREEEPDIICFQEFVEDRGGKFKILDTLPFLQKDKNYYFEHTLAVRKLNYFGIATFTSFPIVNKGKISFGPNTNNICIFTDLNINNKIIRVYNVHFQSIRFKEGDYEFADKVMNMEEIRNDKQFRHKLKKVLRRMKVAYLKRAAQVDIISQHMKDCPYPIIVCGDFNDTPSSYTYYKMARKLDDAFSEGGSGIGETYAGSSFPAFRIDYILHSNNLKSFNYKRDKVNYSDHYPVKCNISY